MALHDAQSMEEKGHTRTVGSIYLPGMLFISVTSWLRGKALVLRSVDAATMSVCLEHTAA